MWPSFFPHYNAKTKLLMRKEKEVTTRCVDVQEIQNYFRELSERITSGRDRVWISKGRTGATNFIIGSETIMIASSKMKKGGVL